MGMVIVQFEDSLRQKSKVQISIWSSYSEKNFYEKETFDDLGAHYHSIALPIQPIPFDLGKDKKSDLFKFLKPPLLSFIGKNN
jgi:hypothetical protein